LPTIHSNLLYGPTNQQGENLQGNTKGHLFHLAPQSFHGSAQGPSPSETVGTAREAEHRLYK